MARRYRGHRASSFVASDINELVEIRARQRTFHGAYSRTALVSLGYSLTSPVFTIHTVGLMFAILGSLLFITAFMRSRQANQDFADRPRKPYPPELVIQTVGQEDKRVFGPPFVTAGWIVIAVSCIVASVELILLTLIFQV
ncbi:hypothetical protein AX15_004773 [Amanita polypyramis BW_CC]|nr:hypothetical protein AX15_004773 [Amanita polypyramis BW_CC]